MERVEGREDRRKDERGGRGRGEERGGSKGGEKGERSGVKRESKGTKVTTVLVIVHSIIYLSTGRTLLLVTCTPRRCLPCVGVLPWQRDKYSQTPPVLRWPHISHSSC